MIASGMAGLKKDIESEGTFEPNSAGRALFSAHADSAHPDFGRKTGRVLAASRALIALVFLLALLLDPAQPVRSPLAGYVLLLGYLIWSLIMAVIAWRSWWYDFRFAPAAHVIDIACFLAAVYFTETRNSEFASPFTAFTVFLLISASMRWGWNGIAGTALVLLVTNAIGGALMIVTGFDIDPYRFARRQTYMVVLAIMLTWISADRRGRKPSALPEPPGVPGERRLQVLAGALTHARRHTGAQGAAIALAQDEEPWIEVMRDTGRATTHNRIGPGPLAESLAQPISGAILFDQRRGRVIAIRSDGRCEVRHGPVELGLATYCQADTGLVVPVCSAAGKGVLLLCGIADLCVDDLADASDLAREIGLALDREEMAALAQSAAISGIRNALARDLHDSVAQFLAGTQFRLGGLRRWLREGRDPEPEIAAMKDALRHEQVQLRAMIQRLRLGESGDRGTDIVAELEALVGELGYHWRIAALLEAPTAPLVVPMALAYELRQVVREAVANAARHGKAGRVVIRVDREGRDLLRMSVRDDGEGFAQQGQAARPRSISERIEALGGRLTICHEPSGASLEIEIPVRLLA